MFGIGTQEMVVFLIIVLIIFGPKQLPKLANSIGRAMRDFKSGMSGVDSELQAAMKEDEAPASTPIEEKVEVRAGEAKATQAEKTD